jgi:hypothetical protein
VQRRALTNEILVSSKKAVGFKKLFYGHFEPPGILERTFYINEFIGESEFGESSKCKTYCCAA